MVKNEKEKNPFINPTAEGSNATSGSKNKGKERASETEGNFASSSSKFITAIKKKLKEKIRDIEWIENELVDREKEQKILKRKMDDLEKRIKKTNDQKELKKLETERLEILREHEELIEILRKDKEIRGEIRELFRQLTSLSQEGTIKTEIDQQINRTSQLIEKSSFFDEKKVEEVLDKIGKEAYDHYSHADSKAWNEKMSYPGDPFSTLGGFIEGLAKAFTPYGTHLHDEWENKAKKEVIKSASKIVTQSSDQVIKFAQELLANRQVLIRIKELMNDKEKETEARVSQLTQEKDEANKKLKNAESKATIITQKLIEREEKIKKEKETEQQEKAEQSRLKGEAQNALLSAERSEIEQLRAERNQLRTNTEEQEKFLSRWIKQYERLELDKAVAVHTVLQYGAEIREYRRDKELLTHELSRIEIEKAAIEVELKDLKAKITRKDAEIENWKGNYENMKSERDNWHQQKNQLENEKLANQHLIRELEAKKKILETKVKGLEIAEKEWKEKYEKEKQQKRIGLIANVAQGAVEWLPIPEKWQGGLKTSIQAASVWALWKDLPNWTYEGLIMVVGVGLWYAIIHILRKINRKIFGKKDKRQISNLEKALTNIIEAGSIGKDKKEPSSPAVVSKEAIITGEVVREISDEKKAPSIAENSEAEKPVKKGKNGKNGKSKKKGKK